MADKYGSLAIPLVAPAAGETVSDHAVDVLLAYLKAFLNAYGVNAWRSICKVPIQNLPVKSTFAHDPEDDQFNEKDIPAIYLFRSGGQPTEDMAEDIRVTHTTMTLWWVFPAERDQDKRTRNRPYINGLAKLIDQAFRKERDPVYVVPGDTATNAATEGSVVLIQAGIQKLVASAPKPKDIQIYKGEKVAEYPTIEMTFEVEEHRDIDLELFDLLDAAEVTITNSDGSTSSDAIYES